MTLPRNPETNDTLSLGIDGGASTFGWSLCTPSGRLHHGSVEGANAQVLGLEPFTTRLLDLVRDLLHDHGWAMDKPITLGLGLSGIDRPAEQIHLTGIFNHACPKLRGFWVGNDALAALRQGAGTLEGLVLIAGSGSICVSVTPTGEIQRAGGWGLTLGDEGGAAWIGQRALNAITRMTDGLITATPLQDILLAELGLPEPQALIPWCSSLDPSAYKRRVAALAPRVIALARSGDPAARAIIDAALDHLAALVTLARKRLLDNMAKNGLHHAIDIPLVCSGGLLLHKDGLFDDLKALLDQRRNNNLTIMRLTEPASLGALALGREYATGQNTPA